MCVHSCKYNYFDYVVLVKYFLNPAGGGGLICDDHGRWVKGFLGRMGKVSSLEAELWAIRDGLILCNRLLIQELFIELDAKAVIRTLWKMQHCYRESNACADALAKKAVSSQIDFCILNTPPVELSQLLMQDLSGLFCNRVCNYTAPVAVV